MFSLILEMFTYPFMVRALCMGVLVALCSALLGVTLVLKRYSMIGDGLSHVGFGALAIATAMKAQKLVFLSDIKGVYSDPDDPSTLISEMTVNETKEFLKSGHAGGGMLPKLQSCVDAIESGVSRVHILDGRIPHSQLLEFFTNRGIGTAIISDQEEKYYTN